MHLHPQPVAAYLSVLSMALTEYTSDRLWARLVRSVGSHTSILIRLSRLSYVILRREWAEVRYTIRFARWPMHRLYRFLGERIRASAYVRVCTRHTIDLSFMPRERKPRVSGLDNYLLALARVFFF